MRLIKLPAVQLLHEAKQQLTMDDWWEAFNGGIVELAYHCFGWDEEDLP